MRLLIVGLLVLIATVAFALSAQQDNGHVIIAYGEWTIESSLVLFVAGLIILFIAFYYSLRLWSGIVYMPQRLRRWRRQRRAAKVRLAYVRGMTALNDGQWVTAEKWLLKRVRDSESPALHYLAAAQAAEAQGSLVRRDSYLRAALNHEPGADVAVGLAQAGYYLQHRQAEEARAILARLHVARPKHAATLKKLMETQIALDDWEGLLQLIPELERRQVITVRKSEELQRTAYRALFALAAAKKDAAYLRQLWERSPRHVRRNEDVLFDYARSLGIADPHAGGQLDLLLSDAIHRRWSDALVYAYGLIPSENLPTQLVYAERWLKHHADNAVLLLTLGRLSVRNQLWGKGRNYLEASLAVEPQAETYRELGALLERLKDPEAALECYRKALTSVPGKSFPSLHGLTTKTVTTNQTMAILPAQTR
jgi:HemY protein